MAPLDNDPISHRIPAAEQQKYSTQRSPATSLATKQ
uniref:Uncharacterized protein n=1 Tax=Rhizophora mucronata TaxID=61149 RepID=A0A2P2NWR1_RHIMU